MIPVETLLAFHRGGQTELQLDQFVTARAGGTLYGCLLQSLRELWKRFRGLRGDVAQRDLLLIDLDELREQSADESFAGRRAAVTLRQKRMHLIEMDKHLETDRREFLRFYSQASALWQALGFDREPPTQAIIERLDAERWEHSLLCQAALSIMESGGVRGNVISLIHSLPLPRRDALLRRCFGPPGNTDRRAHLDSLVGWYLAFDPGLPAPLALSEAQTRELLGCCESVHSPALLRISSATGADSSAETSTPAA